VAFRDLHAIGQLFAEYAGEGRLEVAHYDAYQRKLAYKREWYQFNRARVCAPAGLLPRQQGDDQRQGQGAQEHRGRAA